MMNCKDCQSRLPDLFLSRNSSPEVISHLSACQVCREELAALQATFALLDTWQAPEPSAFFDQRLAAHLREEVGQPRLGFFGRLRDRILFGSNMQLRPSLAGALALALIVGGGTFAGINAFQPAPQPSATVHDLLILNQNQQTIQQLDQLLQEDSFGDAAPAQPAS